MRWFIVIAFVAGCWAGGSTSAPPSPPARSTAPDLVSDIAAAGDACTVDDDCVITNFSTCCACPSCDIGEPSARSATAFAHLLEACRRTACDPHRCDALADMICGQGEAADHFEPRCSKRGCIGVRRAR